MPPRPPTSTLFPYTTLFRSRTVFAGRRRGQRSDGRRSRRGATRGRGRRREYGARRVARQHGHRDRKSTRLNSSHRCISYAVFCLKKKKKKNTGKHCTFNKPK